MFRILAVLTRALHYLVRVSVIFFCFTAYAQAGQVALAWDANTEPTLGGYQLYYGQASGNYTANVDVGNQTSYTVANLLDGNTYYFAVKAYDTTKTTSSSYSNEVSKTITSTTTAPTANFSATPTSGSAPLIVTFTDTSTGNITAWSWNFGDGTTSTGTTAVKTYSNSGSYTATLTVTGPGGGDTATTTISVTAAAPVANFSATPTTGTAPLLVSFSDASTGSITGWSWNFGDGTTSTVQNPGHTFATAGTYTVALTVTGPGGSNTRTKSGYITVTAGGPGGGGGNLVAAYNFEEASGETVVDASGKGNHGTISGATRITSGKFGKALSFDGVNDWVTVNDANSLDLTTAMTLEAWVYPTVAPSGWRTIIHKEQPGEMVYFLHASSTSADRPATGLYIGGAERNLFGGSRLAANTWTHLAATYDGATQRLYVNGIEVANRAQTGTIQTSASPLRIGGNSIWGEYFQGRIDEVRIYNRALTPTEIQTDMSKSVATTSPTILLVGNQTLEPITDVNLPGFAEAFRTTAATTGLITELSVYVDSTSTATKVVAGIYSGKNGHPGTLLAQNTLTSPQSGAWNTLPLAATSVSAGKTYWIALLGPSGSLAFRDRAGIGNGPTETSAQAALTTLPNTWVTGAVHQDAAPMSAYGSGYSGP